MSVDEDGCPRELCGDSLQTDLVPFSFSQLVAVAGVTIRIGDTWFCVWKK